MDNLFDWDSQLTNLKGVAADATKKKEVDDRFWKLKADANGNGVALIRVLPFIKDGKPISYVGYKSAFNKRPVPGGKPKWLIARSLTSIGQKCPISEAYQALMANGHDQDAKVFFKLSKKFICNILVVKDPSDPRNDGKIMLWEFGPNILEKFLGWVKPSKEEQALGTKSKNVFSPLDGYTVKLKLTKPDQGIMNYNSSELAPEASLAVAGVDTFEKYQKFSAEKLYDLDEFLSPEFYPTYEELVTKVEWFYPGALKGIPAVDGSDSSQQDEGKTDWNDVPDITNTVSQEPAQKASGDDENLSWM